VLFVCAGCGLFPVPQQEGLGRKFRYCSIHCRYLAAQRRRRALIGGGGTHSGRDFLRLQRRFGGMCAYCTVRPGTERDHVIPLSRGGTDYIGNILPCCKPCNSTKNDRFIIEWRYGRPQHQTSALGA
jgi:5-methylcytosine-specific restriction endonuclease McrA